MPDGFQLYGLFAYPSVNTTPETCADVSGEVLLFASKPVIKVVVAGVERCAAVGPVFSKGSNLL